MITRYLYPISKCWQFILKLQSAVLAFLRRPLMNSTDGFRSSLLYHCSGPALGFWSQNLFWRVSASRAGLALGAELLGTAIAAEHCSGFRILLKLQALVVSFFHFWQIFFKASYTHWRLLKSQFVVSTSMKVSSLGNFHIAGGCNLSVARLTKGKSLFGIFFMYSPGFGWVSVLPSSLPGLAPRLSILRCPWWL